MVDILVLTRYLRRPFLMKRSVLVSPIGWGTYLAGSIGLDRSSAESRKRALQQTIDMACRSMSVIVFPEGTFGHTDGRLRTPHLNGVRVAYDAGLSVLPLGLAGTRRALDGQSLPLHSNAEIALVIRRPLCPRDFCDGDAFATACWEEVTRAVSAARRYVPRGWPYTTGLC
jgi:1-acyl-sn-glycerol-3-phosphate acyltransferase